MSNELASGARRWRVALVDDDTDSLRALARLLATYDYEVITFSSSAAFLQSLDVRPPEILVVDLRMPELDGLTLQTAMRERSLHIPTVFLTGFADVATSVQALRGGAVDFLEKPVDGKSLMAALERATTAARYEREITAIGADLRERWSMLTPREREVCRWVVSGRLNKQIAAALGTTEKTVKVHRSRVMLKMHADSVASLVRMVDLVDDETEAPLPPSLPSQHVSTQYRMELKESRENELRAPT
jgi:FixJ family two-component response regulator